MNNIYYKRKMTYAITIGIVIVLFIIFKIQSEVSISKEFHNEIKQLYSDINKEAFVDIDKLEKKLNDKEKYSEVLTLIGIEEYKNNNFKKSKEKLNLALKNENKRTNYISIFYTHKYLFQICKQEKNYEQAKRHLADAIKSIPKKYLNEEYEEIGELIALTYDVDILRGMAIDIFGKLIEKTNHLSNEAEIYLRERMRTIYILSNRYAEATNSLIDSIILSKEIGDTYSLANSMISLGIVIAEIGGYETATNIIEDALKLDIYNKDKDAYTKTFGYLNLACIEFYYLNESDKAIDTLSNIEQYRNLYTEEDFRDIEIYELIYSANSHILKKQLDLAKENLDKIETLLKKDKDEYYINKELEFKLAYARYFHVKGNYNEALDIYKYALDEFKLANNKEMQKNILSEIIKLSEDMKQHEDYHKYTTELLNITNDMEKFRYNDYYVYIVNSVKEKNQIEHNYNQYINTIKALFISIILILIFYMYTSKRIKKLKYSSEYDGLTNIYNRKKFDIDYNRLLKKNQKFSCVIMDIDNFKKINDNFGHGFGDVVLINSSKKIKNLLPKNYNLYRYGGEEFIVLATYKNKHEVSDISEQIRKSIEEMTWKENTTVTMSIGVAFSDIEKENVLKASDENLYKAKNSGKNKVVY